MESQNTYNEALIHEFTQNYMEKLFYFSLKKTGNSYEAENLTSDIALNILIALSKGTVPKNFSPWVWQIARNRYSVWADKKHKQAELVTGFDISDYEIEDGSANMENEWIHSETLALLRRELAFISTDYRTIVVSYYMKNLSVKTISQTLHLPEGTVKTKLFRARKILKEGMRMAREFGNKSYNPEEIRFCASGSQPSGLPWRVVNRKIPKNILLQASNNPSTLEELSMELGIAVPYMEEEVNILQQATLLKKIDDKYITDFFIADKECQLAIYHVQKLEAKERSRMLDEIVTENLSQFRALGIAEPHICDNTLKWWLMIYAVDFCVESIASYNICWPQKRANGETWGFIGYESTKLPEEVVMGHNGCGNEKAMFWAYKIGDYNLWNQVGEMSYAQVLLLEDLLKNKRNIATLTESESALWKGIAGKYAHCDQEGCVIPDILVISRAQLAQVEKIIQSHPNFSKVMENFSEAFAKTMEVLKRYSHEVLHQTLPYCASMEILNTRMMMVHDEVESGKLLLPADSNHSTLGMHLIVE